MKQLHLMRVMLAAALATMISCGCGTNGVGPGGSAPAGAGLVAVQPKSPAAAPPSAPGAGAEAVPNAPPALPLEAQQAIAASKARLAESKAATAKIQIALDAMKAELAASAAAAELERDPTPEEREEDRQLHPASQVWLTLSNLKVVKGELNDVVISVDYRLACGSPRRYGLYDMRVYLLTPDEKKISEDTKMVRKTIQIADKASGTLTLRTFDVIQNMDQHRLAVVLVKDFPKHYELENYLISGFLTPEMQSSAADPPPLPAGQIGEEARDKEVVLAPPRRLGPIQLMHSLDFDFEFQVQAPDRVFGQYRLIIVTATGTKIIYDVSRDIISAEPYMRVPLHIRGEPVSRAPARPYRVHVERKAENNIDWEPVSNLITLQ